VYIRWLSGRVFTLYQSLVRPLEIGVRKDTIEKFNLLDPTSSVKAYL
jgi:hypothetical protein